MPQSRLHKTAPRQLRAIATPRKPRLHKTPRRGEVVPLEARIPRNATFRRQYVLCGKARCPKWHGPYWYAFVKVDGKTRSYYIGKEAAMARVMRAHSEPPERLEALAAEPPLPPREWRAARGAARRARR